MQETKDSILAKLGAATGLETQPYGPHLSELDEYLAPGNYVNAESVERGAEGDKFNWVAYSSYGRKDYVNGHDLAVKLERVFSDDELCRNVHIRIYQNDDKMAHRVEYRFHTFGIELSASPDALDFCPSCGWNTESIKCNAGPDNHPSEDCHYLCSNCGSNTGITTPCLRKISFNTEIKMDAFLVTSPNVVSAVSHGVKNAIGEVLVGYALVENNLRAMMVSVPGHEPGSNLSSDVKRLKKHKGAIVASASSKSSDAGKGMEECIDAIISAYDNIRNKRNALAHGQLVEVGLSTFTIGDDDADGEKGQGSRLQIEHYVKSERYVETIELTEDGIQRVLDNVRELQARVRSLGQIVESLASG